ncbi:RNA-guided endonuclease InsQ/TnpB family protein [Shimazuella kribbensis]|uniref:RNA-guided endonuclease InsQ/TnpB family protein n=1 Tax=Shimazuella kribbensis TaxID=139808 RepID=UPI000423ACC5|nr:RNA-guided endonuclease TnpB family protein [Shimazuella kribbensis]
MTTITAKIQIYVPQEKVESLLVTTRSYRKACNFVSRKIFETKMLKQRPIHDLYYHELRSAFGLKSQMAQSVIKTVIARYKSAKSNGHDWSLIRFQNPEYDLVWNRDYSLVQDTFSVNTIDGRIKCSYETKGTEHFFVDNWKFGTAKVVFQHKKWFLHIPMTKAFSELQDEDVSQVVGIDLGLNFLATTYDSQGKTLFYNGKSFKHKRAKYKALRKQLQQKQTASARRRLQSIGSRENRWMMDINHRITKALVNQYGDHTLFVLEDLQGVRHATEKVKVCNRYVSVSWAFYQFRRMLEYKARMNRQKVMVVNPKYTSQTCPNCGHVEKSNRDKKKHLFCCKNCHYRSNDDRIGAMNLQRLGIEYIVEVTTGA